MPKTSIVWQVSSEVSTSLSARLGPTWQQQRLWLFLRGLTIVFLCSLLHGSNSSSFINAVRLQPLASSGGNSASLSLLKHHCVDVPALNSLAPHVMQILTRDDKVTFGLVMLQLSVAFQRALIAFPLRFDDMISFWTMSLLPRGSSARSKQKYASVARLKTCSCR